MTKFIKKFVVTCFAVFCASTHLGHQGAFAADAAKGEKFYRVFCRSCHTLEERRRSVGPHFSQLFGRLVGSVEGYRYSRALRDIKKEGVTWSSDNMANFLEDPKTFVRRWAYGRSRHYVMCKKAGKVEQVKNSKSSLVLTRVVDCKVAHSPQDLDNLKAYLETK